MRTITKLLMIAPFIVVLAVLCQVEMMSFIGLTGIGRIGGHGKICCTVLHGV